MPLSTRASIVLAAMILRAVWASALGGMRTRRTNVAEIGEAAQGSGQRATGSGEGGSRAFAQALGQEGRHERGAQRGA